MNTIAFGEKPSDKEESGAVMSESKTPRTDNLVILAKELGARRTPAFGDAVRLCRQLERELNEAIERATTAELDRDWLKGVNQDLRKAVETLRRALMDAQELSVSLTGCKSFIIEGALKETEGL